jgi:hypothetical protein
MKLQGMNNSYALESQVLSLDQKFGKKSYRWNDAKGRQSSYASTREPQYKLECLI